MEIVILVIIIKNTTNIELYIYIYRIEKKRKFLSIKKIIYNNKTQNIEKIKSKV